MVSARYSGVQWGTVLVSALYSGIQWGTLEVSRTVQWDTVGYSAVQ